MLLKIALWYIHHYTNKMPTGIGRLDENDQVVWPAAS